MVTVILTALAYLLDGIMLQLYYSKIFGPRYSGKITCMGTLIWWLALCICKLPVLFMADTYNITMISLLQYALLAVYISVLFQSSPVIKFLAAILNTVSLGCAEFLAVHLTRMLVADVGNKPLQMGSSFSLAGLLLMRPLVLLAFQISYLLWETLEKLRLEKDSRLWLCILLPLSQILMLAGNISARHPLNFWGYTGIVLSIAADVLMLYILIWSSKQEKLKTELQEISYLQETEHMRNELLEQKQKELLEQRTSFEHQMGQIRQKFLQGESEAARRELNIFQENIGAAFPSDFCQNFIVNAILSEKENFFEKLKVKTEFHLLIPRGLKLDPLHLCSLFSNLLDNALEALEEFPETERRFRLDAELRGAYLFVKAQNPAAQSHVQRKRRKDRGYGTQILKDIAKTYDGNYEAKYKNGWYTAVIMVKAV